MSTPGVVETESNERAGASPAPASRATGAAAATFSDVGAELAAAQPLDTIPALIVGGSGYVVGELLRLLVTHPVLRPATVISESHAGSSVEAVFPHLAGCYPRLALTGADAIARAVGEHPRLAAFCAAPHGAAASHVEALLGGAERTGCDLSLVDLSGDFRFADAAQWERVYGHAHGAPSRVAGFARGVPELVPGVPSVGTPSGSQPGVPPAGTPSGSQPVPARAIAHPGCFTTAVLLAAVPLMKLGLVAPEMTVVATTGSTGAGRNPGATTHHPERRSNLFAYSPLAHRHQPEMESLAAAAGAPLRVSFVPQAGPFARGIYATLVMKPRRHVDAAAARAALVSFYADAPFVQVGEEPPRLQSVVGTNRCALAVFSDAQAMVAISALDNLGKGAAGGAIQWMNRLRGLDETAGLVQPGLGWL